ncbi:hypothetical protein Voc01_027520 [Virgisporangium ochraceum]|uniref:ParB/Sulfiredoxin domain-containing protein n=1 Tax=Virgisporangium ochraceum TaxID=65505 RepID=A0A8J3ZUP3_9ACTN|nr:hypothetical protein Voc01_027520 [Virgisporangium ochraceum]
MEVPDGLGVVAVLGNDFASLLCLGGQPAVLHAHDCHGSVGQLAARAEPGAVRPADLDALRDWLAAPGLNPRRPPPAGPLAPLLRLLAPGRYTLALSTPGWQELPVLDPAPGAAASWYWPTQGDALVVTDHWPPRDQATVESYRARISGGARPAAVVVRAPGGGPRYLVDGHHKLAAYRRTHVRPLLIEIAPEKPMPLRREEFAAAVPPAQAKAFAAPLDDWTYSVPSSQ